MVAQLKEGKTGVVIPYNNGWDLANVTNWSDIITIKINDETTTDMTGIFVTADKLSGKDVAVYFNKEGHTSSKVIMTVDLEIKDYESFMAINDNPDGRFIVTKDIMFASSQKTTNPSYIMTPFTGYIDGQDHYLFEFNIDTTSSNAGFFKGTDTDTPALAIKATLAVSSKLDDETVYNMTKTLFENLDELARAHAKGKEVSVESAVTGVSVPFHPGALKYYKEIGLLN